MGKLDEEEWREIEGGDGGSEKRQRSRRLRSERVGRRRGWRDQRSGSKKSNDEEIEEIRDREVGRLGEEGIEEIGDRDVEVG